MKIVVVIAICIMILMRRETSQGELPPPSVCPYILISSVDPTPPTLAYLTSIWNQGFSPTATIQELVVEVYCEGGSATPTQVDPDPKKVRVYYIKDSRPWLVFRTTHSRPLYFGLIEETAPPTSITEALSFTEKRIYRGEARYEYNIIPLVDPSADWRLGFLDTGFSSGPLIVTSNSGDRYTGLVHSQAALLHLGRPQ